MGNNISSFVDDKTGGSNSSSNSTSSSSGGFNAKDHNIDSIDFVATHYILTMNFESLNAIQTTSNCEELRYITSESLNKRVTNETILRKHNMVYNLNYNKDDVISMCRDLGMFYVDIAKTFAAIVLAINPEYAYTDNNGQLVKKNIKTKNEIPLDKPLELSKLSFCGSRINNLKSPTDNDHICVAELNLLEDVFGIPELFDLYCDKGFDCETNQFMDMSEDTRKIYERDLNIFYSAFTGMDPSTRPENIKKFGDISLKSYKQNSICKPVEFYLDPKYLTEHEELSAFETNKEKLLFLYGNNLRDMIKEANDNQLILINILNELFTYDIEKTRNQKMPTINPLLTREKLNTLMLTTRETIAKMILKCELDYLTGIKIYEAIVNKQIFETTQKQLDELSAYHEALQSK